MSSKKILVVGDSLVGALTAILAKAKDSELHVQLVEFEGQLKEFLQQPSAAAAELNLVVNEWKDKYVGLEQLLAEEREVANQTINELKLQLNEALTIKEKSTGKPTVNVNGQVWVINHGAHPHSAKEIAADSEKAKAVLKIKGQNALTKL